MFVLVVVKFFLKKNFGKTEELIKTSLLVHMLSFPVQFM